MCTVDFIGLPFVTSVDDIIEARNMFGDEFKGCKILPKVDSLDAVQRYAEILEEADGSVFQRNELQWEFHAEKLVVAEKWCIAHSNSISKPIIIQSQVLESMIANEEPDRSEVTAVTSAGLEGVDAIMLCHETSIGKYPIDAMNHLAKGIAEAENVYDYDQAFINIKKQIAKPGAQTVDVLAQNGA